jgi:hypothetical protein
MCWSDNRTGARHPSIEDGGVATVFTNRRKAERAVTKYRKDGFKADLVRIGYW